MSDFSKRWSQRHRRLDDEFGERLELVPQASGRYVAAGDDPSRPARQVIGILDLKPTVRRPEGRHAFSADRPDVVTTNASVDFAEEALGPADQWPRKGDVIRALDRDGAPEVEVVTELPSGIGRVSYRVRPR